MPNIFSQLQKLSFRGISVPCAGFQYGFQQDKAEHKYIFRDDPILESLGVKAQTFKYKIEFRDGMELGNQFGDAFSDLYELFRKACLDKSIGILEDPVHGSYAAQVADFRAEGDISKKNGVTVEVEFVYSPTDFFDNVPAPSIQSASAEAGQLDTRISKANFGLETPPTSFKNPLDSISSLANQVTGNLDRIGGQIDAQVFKLNKAEASLKKVGDAKNWGVVRSIRNLQLTLHDTKKNLGGKSGRYRQYTTTAPIDVYTLAARLGISVGDLIRQNPSLSNSPTVNANVTVGYSKDV